MLTREQFADASLAFHEQLFRRILGREDLMMLYFIKARSFDLCLTAAYVPLQRTFMRELEMDEGAVSRSLKRLKGWNVILEERGLYWINADFGEWSAPRRPEVIGWQQHHTPLELPAELAEFKAILRESFLAKAAGQARRFLGILPHPERAAVVPGFPDQTDSGFARGQTAGATIGNDADWSQASLQGEPTAGGELRPDDFPVSISPGGKQTQAGTEKIPAALKAEAAATVNGLDEKSSSPGAAVAEGLDEKSSSAVRPNVHAPPEYLTKNQVPSPAALPRRFPPHTPPLGRLNVERLTYKPGSTLNELAKLDKKSSWSRRVPIGRAEEQRLMACIERAVGAADMKNSGGFWRAYVVRNIRSEIIEEWAADCESRVKTGFHFENTPGAWLNAAIAKAIEIRSLGLLPPGMGPV